ncbi:MAG: bile acid:sodium symporter, partial [Halobacteria archaeon]|nr:bile acid:sodium symporter [Halobacteria archaeon]
MIKSAVTRVADVIDDYLLVWVVVSVGVGLAFPSLESLTSFSTLILAVMIGAVSLTLSPERFRQIRPKSLVTILAFQSSMPFVAFAVALALGLSPAFTAGFVVVGAVTPELVTPTMTELSGGDTALATVALVSVGLGTLVFVPGVVSLLLGNSVSIDSFVIVEQLLLAVVIPMVVAVAIRYRWSKHVSRYDEIYPSVSGLMVILIIGIV